MKTVLELPEPHRRALALILRLVPPERFIWALTGSAGLRLQGVDVPVRDLDLQSDGRTIFVIEKRLSKYMQKPVAVWESAGMRSLDGKAEIEGVEVELLADITHRNPDGSWSAFTDLSHRAWLDWHGRRLPVFPLEDEAAAYEAMGRVEKANLIRLALGSKRKSRA